MSERMADATLEALAERVADLGAKRLAESVVARRWLTPAELAELLAVERDYVYQHASELGARRLGDGPRARLRFRLEDVERAIHPIDRRPGDSPPRADSGAPKAGTGRRRRRAAAQSDVSLLPIRGRSGESGA